MAGHESVAQSLNYIGMLLGLCRCGGKPAIQRSKYTGSFRAKCSKCHSITLDYMTMDHCITAWNSKNTLSLSEEIKRIKDQ